MSIYKRTYFNWFILVVWIAVITHITFAFIYQWGNNPVDYAGYIIFLILFLGVFSGLYRFQITIDDKKIELKFGIGLVKRTIPLATIQEVNLIENKYKYSPSKSGLKDFRSYQWPTLNKKAVEIKLWSKTGIIVGTNKPSELCEELKKRIIQ